MSCYDCVVVLFRRNYLTEPIGSLLVLLVAEISKGNRGIQHLGDVVSGQVFRSDRFGKGSGNPSGAHLFQCGSGVWG